MKVTLIDWTKNAKELLIFSKKTRLKMSPDGFKDIMNLSEEEKDKELDYVFGTIKGSLEFISFVIAIENVTRAFTHQLVRHRVGVSFAQQSQRTVDASGFNYLSTGKCENNELYKSAMEQISTAYSKLITDGVAPEDARGLLPTNIFTNILMKINLRSLSDMMNQRLCNRAQKEFRDVMLAIREVIFKKHPWLADRKILECYCDTNKKCFFKNGKGCGKYK